MGDSMHIEQMQWLGEKQVEVECRVDIHAGKVEYTWA